ncbi:hypothetical protein DPMN_023759 [Dreissena polymorpha]|uniref:Uncharacterized protein n=1 Tax=Dreissena polymorpha TaxID=45954 RepID=A0A9D4RA69_DREPO|nr:hypothetical protein DPMN_023759 [Dreissena polymorpha]
MAWSNRDPAHQTLPHLAYQVTWRTRQSQKQSLVGLFNVYPSKIEQASTQRYDRLRELNPRRQYTRSDDARLN